ncbi:hypothetical protein NQ314_005541 [Rhamnusium bicolor]|uniref:Uncharacterized protein n=1 Tax=Rhamnusium bicolor TaxID=1586634 RepID=A0AAV8ZIH7_9CUCU|nr:hypothetical protein NQ314_005541 [Rhamnusium bicolor]
MLVSESCCTIDVWGIALNITLQDAPFLAFRLLLITHFQIISYMNVFFTCKNTLVILLQIYRLYVVYSEHNKKQSKEDFELTNISIISRGDMCENKRRGKKNRRDTVKKQRSTRGLSEESEDSSGNEASEDDTTNRKNRETKGRRKLEDAFSEESESDATYLEDKEELKKEKSRKSRNKDKKYEKETTVSVTTSDPSSD